MSGGFDDTVRMWDTRQGKCVKILSDHSDPVTSVDMNHDDSLICSTSFDGLLRLWDARVGNCISILQEDQFPPRPLTFGKFTPNGKFVLMMTLDGTLMLIDVDTTEVGVLSANKTLVAMIFDLGVFKVVLAFILNYLLHLLQSMSGCLDKETISESYD